MAELSIQSQESLNSSISINATTVPKIIFIIPYRNRKQHQVYFSYYIQKIMEDIPSQDWMYYFVHQTDDRPFNRGAMKNIGFLAIKYKYPNVYKNIILIFNDIDTLPYDKNVLDYNTTAGTIKHFYGFHFALGGIFSITGGDFEKTNGFPNFWAWGGEDNLIYERAKRVGLSIDRSTFFSIGNMNILQLADGFKRLICRDELATSLMPEDNIDGITTIKNLNYIFQEKSNMIDVSTFDTLISHKSLSFEEQTLDRLNKIRVSTKNAKNNINELKSNYFSDMIPPPNPTSSVYSTIISPSQAYINNIITPILPFSNTQIYQRTPNKNPALPTFIPLREPVANTASYGHVRGVQPDANVVLPINRHFSAHRKFGMRTMFM